MPFWACYYHIVWATKHREALITPQIERVIFETIGRCSSEMDSPILAVNGAEDHVHIAVMIRPRIALAEWVKNAKGASAHSVNLCYPNQPSHFRWQGGYGVHTFGAKQLPYVVAYIQNQKQHHQDKTFVPYLEQTGDED